MRRAKTSCLNQLKCRQHLVEDGGHQDTFHPSVTLSMKPQRLVVLYATVASNDRCRLDHGAASLGVLPATEQGAIIAVSGSHRLRSLSKGDRQKATRKERGRRRVCRSGVTRTHRDCRGTRNVAPPNSVLQSLAICRRHKIKKQGLGIGRGSCQFWVC